MSEKAEMPEGMDNGFSEQIRNQCADQDQDRSPIQRQDEQDEGQEVVPAEMMVLSGAIPHILESIVSHLPPESLKEYRLINSDWNRAAVLQLRKVFPFVRLNSDKDIKSFLDCVKDTKISLFTKFSLRNSLYRDLSKPLLGMLFKTIAPAATHLIINYRLVPNKFEFEIKQKLDYPSLTVLEQRVRYYSNEELLPLNGILEQELEPLLQMVENSPNLKKLDITSPTSPRKLYSYVFNLLIDSIEKKKTDSLAHLRLGIRRIGFEDGHFVRLSRLGLRLKSFTFDGLFTGICNNDDADGEGNSEGKELIEFLHSQSNSLEELELVHVLGVFDQLEFPPLMRLTILKVEGWEGQFDFDFHVTPKIDYNRSFPVLKSVEFIDFYSRNYDFNWVHFLPDPTSTPALSVMELKLPMTGVHAWRFSRDDYEEYETQVLHAAKFLPNLKILRIPANRKLVKIIHNWLPQLEELTLEIRDRIHSLDSIITGFSWKKCDRIRECPEEMFQSFEASMENLDFRNESRRPLSFLKCLKILRLDTGEDDLAEISTLSTRLVLTKMPSLQTVDFGRRTTPIVQELEGVFNDLRRSGKLVFYELEDYE